MQSLAAIFARPKNQLNKYYTTVGFLPIPQSLEPNKIEVYLPRPKFLGTQQKLCVPTGPSQPE